MNRRTSKQNPVPQCRSFRPGLESLEKLVLLSFTPTSYSISVDSYGQAQAAGGPTFSFNNPFGTSLAKSFPGSLQYSSGSSALCLWDQSSAAATAQASTSETESQASDGSQSGKLVFGGSFTNAIVGTGSASSDDNSGWGYSFSSDTYFTVKLSYSVTWSSNVLASSDVGSVNVTNLTTGKTVSNAVFSVQNGQTLTGSASVFVGPGQYSISVNANDNAVTTSGTTTSNYQGTANWSLVPYVLTLSTVSFGNGSDGFHLMSADPTASGVTNYTAPQWNPDAHKAYPVLYVSGSTPTVAATFQLPTPVEQLQPVQAEGIGIDGFKVSPTKLTQSGDQLSLSNLEMSQSFASKVQYFQDFTIDWKLSYDGGKDWIDVGTSDNPFYVTAAAPKPDPITGGLYLTVVNSEVTHTQGLTSGDTSAIVNQTWSLFTGLNVTNYAGQPLHYYQNPNTQNTTVAQLLATGDGQCSTWTGLFLDMLLVNGVNPPDDYVTVTPAAGPPFVDDKGFLVKNWVFVGSGTSGNALYPYVNTATIDEVQPAKAGNLAGQNNPQPIATFNNHQVAFINGTYYDPSYGVTYNSLLQMEQNTISGFWFNGLYNGQKATYFRPVTASTAREADLTKHSTPWSP